MSFKLNLMASTFSGQILVLTAKMNHCEGIPTVTGDESLRRDHDGGMNHAL